MIFDFSNVTHIDDSAAHVIALLFERADKEKTQAVVMGLSGDVRDILDAFGVLRRVPENRMVPDLEEARTLAARLLTPAGSNNGSAK